MRGVRPFVTVVTAVTATDFPCHRGSAARAQSESEAQKAGVAADRCARKQGKLAPPAAARSHVLAHSLLQLSGTPPHDLTTHARFPSRPTLSNPTGATPANLFPSLSLVIHRSSAVLPWLSGSGLPIGSMMAAAAARSMVLPSLSCNGAAGAIADQHSPSDSLCTFATF